MSIKPPSEILAMNAEVGNRIGRGQDNLVYKLNLPETAEKMIESGEWVVKVSHKGKGAENKRDWTKDSTEAAITGAAYKKNKYEILKHFLGDYIPESMFFVSEVQDANGKIRPAEITMQKRVPDFRLDQLTQEQRSSPKLHTNLVTLMNRMQYMYSVLGEVNARTSSGVNLDAKMDLGGVSDFVRAQSFDYTFTEDDAKKTTSKISSPNLLVDPDSLDVYCIDFDQGDWAPGMDEAKAFAFEMDESRQNRSAEMAQLALNGGFRRRSTD